MFFKDELWLHVRSLGNWTNKLYEYFSDYALNKNQVPSGIEGGPAVYNRKMSNMGKKFHPIIKISILFFITF